MVKKEKVYSLHCYSANPSRTKPSYVCTVTVCILIKALGLIKAIIKTFLN